MSKPSFSLQTSSARVAVMQPYFFPYLGQFELINRTTKWVVLDTVQYIRRGWMNRNRILHPSGQGWQYITAPVKKQQREALVKDISVVDGPEWKTLLLKQLQHYRKAAPYYEQTLHLVEQVMSPKELSLSRINVNGLKVFSVYLGLGFDYEYSSHLPVVVEDGAGPDEWPFQVAKAVGAKEYINPPGGASIYDGAKFARAGIKLTIQPMVDFRYACGRFAFEPGLSIIDVCMWNSPEEIRAYLDGYAYEAQAA